MEDGVQRVLVRYRDQGNDRLARLVNLFFASRDRNNIDTIIGGVLGGEFDRNVEIVLKLKFKVLQPSDPGSSWKNDGFNKLDISSS